MQFTITLPSGTKLEPTKEQLKHIESILFGTPESLKTPSVLPTPLVKRTYKKRSFTRWTTDQDQGMRNILNNLVRENKKPDMQTFREIGMIIGKPTHSTAARYYDKFRKEVEAGNFV